MAGIDPNEEWLGHVQPVGLVVAPIVLARYGLVPAIQTRTDTEALRPFISPKPEDDRVKSADPRALKDPWGFFHGVLGWSAAKVAGTPGGPTLPEDLILKVDESDTEIAPNWAVTGSGVSWQILVRIEGPGVRPDVRGALAGWEATPHQRFERLLREKQIPIGLLITDDDLRLVYAPRGETSGWLTFPLRSLIEVGARPMLGGLKLLLNSFRLHNAEPERRLPGLLRASREAQAEVSTRLAAQVLGALHELLRGLHAADRRRIEVLASNAPEHLYDGLLTVLLRLVFLLYAEDRDLIPSRTDAEARAFYVQGYGVRSLYARLLDDKAHHPDTMDERRGAWGQLLALFALLHHGDSTGNWIRGRGGRLFDPTTFPFLQGQDNAADPPAPAPVSDGFVLRILDLLITVDGEKLSYRTLDVEQIGSVYETVMGFTIETPPGPAVAIKAGKNDRTPVFVNIAELAATKGPERAKFLKEKTARNSLSDKVAKALSAAAEQAAVLEALRPIVDERGSPGGHVSPPGMPLLQPTEERRRTGSHYTPRSLTAPIVEHALELAFERLGPDARPEDVLALKVCDPAMGSGAFLVEACRALGDRLVLTWARWPKTRPKIPDDEDEPLHARRLVAQRCLYGVDKNPRAVELAKLSLWLATLARDHEFTFLDHALKAGDSLVGLSQAQIAAVDWDESKPGLPLFRQFVANIVDEALRGRREIQEAPDDTMRAIQEARFHKLDDRIQPARIIGDATIAAFFAGDKPRARERRRQEVESLVSGSLNEAAWDRLGTIAATLREGEHPILPFHWRLAFPEVFVRENPGFDAIVGNPPFMGGTVVSSELGMPYFRWLGTRFDGVHHLCDLVAYFFRRAYDQLRNRGCFGLIATNSISQGDTREGGLTQILARGGTITKATRRLPWPGEAAVIVSVVHVLKGDSSNKAVLDEKYVPRIAAFLVAGTEDRSPHRLQENPFYSLGSKIYGQGFLFDDADIRANPTELMRKLIADEPELSERIFPYVGGEEINNLPRANPSRWAIYLSDLQTEDELDRYPALKAIIERKVKPERMLLGNNPNNVPLKRRWWCYQAHRPELYQKLQSSRYAICNSQVSNNLAFTTYPKNFMFSQTACVIPSSSISLFGILQSRLHEVWARFFGSTMKDDLRYTPSDCFETFPFPTDEVLLPLESASDSYYQFRADLMISRGEGLTKTYKRFHQRDDISSDVDHLRGFQLGLDHAVFRAYGWSDLADRAEPFFLDDSNEDDHAYQGRLFWPSAFRDEVLARLLALNAERAAAERAAGLAPLTTEANETEELEA